MASQRYFEFSTNLMLGSSDEEEAIGTIKFLRFLKRKAIKIIVDAQQVYDTVDVDLAIPEKSLKALADNLAMSVEDFIEDGMTEISKQDYNAFVNNVDEMIQSIKDDIEEMKE